MASYFLDSSALVKRYISEFGSGWVGEIMDPSRGNVVHVSAIAEVEVVAALARRSKMPGADPQALSVAIARFRADFNSTLLVLDITPNLLADASQLAEKYLSRGYDAMQLASLLLVNSEYRANAIPLILLSSDDDLNAAAVAEGVAVTNPNAHP